MCVTCNVVDVELRDEVAKGGDVDFVGFEVSAHPAGDLAGFVNKLGLLRKAEFKDFAQVRALGDEDEPGVEGIIHQ